MLKETPLCLFLVKRPGWPSSWWSPLPWGEFNGPLILSSNTKEEGDRNTERQIDRSTGFKQKQPLWDLNFWLDILVFLLRKKERFTVLSKSNGKQLLKLIDLVSNWNPTDFYPISSFSFFQQASIERELGTCVSWCQILKSQKYVNKDKWKISGIWYETHLIHFTEGKTFEQNAKYCALVYLPNREKCEF